MVTTTLTQTYSDPHPLKKVFVSHRCHGLVERSEILRNKLLNLTGFFSGFAGGIAVAMAEICSLNSLTKAVDTFDDGSD